MTPLILAVDIAQAAASEAARAAAAAATPWQAPAWLLFAGAVAGALTAVMILFITAVTFTTKVGRPAARWLAGRWAEAVSPFKAADVVQAGAPRWDAAAAALGRIEGKVDEIRHEVQFNDGDSLKDRIVEHQQVGDERHAKLDEWTDQADRRLGRIEKHVQVHHQQQHGPGRRRTPRRD